MERKDIFLLISKGKISEANEELLTQYGEVFDSKITLPLIITLCKSVSENNCDNADDVLHLAILCCRNLPSLKDIEKDNFILSIYHVIKYLCKHKLLNDSLTLLAFIKEIGIKDNFKSDFYNHYIALFHNNFFQKPKDISGDMLLTVVTYCVQFHLLLKTHNFNNFLVKVKTYVALFKYSNSTNDHRNKFCSLILKLLKNCPPTADKNENDMYLLLLNVINLIIHCLTVCEEFPDFIQDLFKETCNIMKLKCCSSELADCIDILKYLSLTLIKNVKYRTENDCNLLEDCRKLLNATIRKRSSNTIVITTYIQIGKILRQIFEYYQNCKNSWETCFSIPIQVEILRIIEFLGQFLSNNSVNVEKCCPDCTFETDYFQAAIITSCAGIFINTSLRTNMACSVELHSLSLRCLTNCCKYVFKLKQRNCEKFIQIWRIIGIGTYNTAVILYRNKEYKFAKLYVHLFVKYLFLLEGTNNSDLCFPNSLGSSLHLYAVCCSNLNEKRECILYLSLTILLSSEYKKKAFQTWVLVKSSDSNDEEGFKSTSLYQVLNMEQDAIREIWPSYIYNHKECEELLMDELQYYDDNWKSKIPFVSVCNAICKVSQNPIYRTKAFVMTWDKVVTMLDKDYIKNLETTIEMIVFTTNVNMKMCLSILYFIQYQFKMQGIIEKNISEMNETCILTKETSLQPYEEPPNPNDKCDIVPAFYNMKIDQLQAIYKLLDQSLEILDLILNDKKYKLDFNVVATLKLSDIIKLIAYEYRLQKFDIKMFQVWILYYKFSILYGNHKDVVTSIGFIIEFSDCKSKTIKTLEKEAENLLANFDTKDTEELNIYLTYFINKCSGYLKNDLIEEGYEVLCIVEKYFKQAQDAKLKICEARTLYLITSYLQLPCNNKILQHTRNFLVTAQASYNILAEFYTIQSPKCSYLTSVLLEIALYNGWMYKWLRLPREVRCYCKEAILLAQKCVLPIRTAQFLSLLAFTDLLDLHYDDCDVKLNGLANLLCYGSKISYEKLPIQKNKSDSFKLENSHGDLSDIESPVSTIQTVLDIPTEERRLNILTGSPELRKKSFVYPEFIKHSNSCECFMCLHYEYQRLILDTIHLEAVLNLYQNIGNCGKDHFIGGLTLCEKLSKKSESFYYKSLRFMNNNILACVYKTIFESYCTFLLDYSYFLIQKNSLSGAKNVLDKVFNIISNKKIINNNFWNELMIQKFNLIDVELQMNECDEQENISNDLANELQVPTNVLQPTTPENKISKTNIQLTITPIDCPKPVKNFKKLKFDLSEDETIPKTPEESKHTIFKLHTPAKTPAPFASKIKIYTPKTVKTKRTTTTSTKSKLPVLHQAEKNNVTQWENRKKLLTEKLKAEQAASKQYDNIEETTSDAVRKKLLDDLDEVTQAVDQLSIKPKGKQIIQKVANSKVTEERRKKYNRIKMPSSSSSSDSSTGSVGVRKSSRIRNVEKTT